MKPTIKHILLGKYSFLLLSAILFILSFAFNKKYNNESSVSQEVRVAEKYLHHLQKDFNEFLKDTARLGRLLGNTESLYDFNRLASKRYSIFLYHATDSLTDLLKFWNNKLVAPSPGLLNETDGEYFSRLLNGWYFTIKKSISNNSFPGNVIAYAMIPVRSYFFIETDYLPREFVYSNTADKRVMISEEVTNFPVRSATGKTLFYFDKKTTGTVPYSNRITIFFWLVAIICLFIFIHLLVESLAHTRGAWKAIGILILLLSVFRLITYYFPSVFNQRQFELFSPLIYGSNFIQRSLGDLLVNSFLFCWIVLFAWSKLHQQKNFTVVIPHWLKWVAGIASLYLLIFSTFILAAVIRSLVADSKISFDVTDFFGLNFYSVIGFVVLACQSLFYYYFSRLIFRFISFLLNGNKVFIYFGIGIAGLIYLTIRWGHPDVLFYLPVLCWLLGYSILVTQEKFVINRARISISGILSWIFIFSVSIAIIMLSENSKVELEKRKLIAEKLALQTDPSSERLMSIAIQYLDNDFLSENFYRFSNPEKGKVFRDSIITENYSGYLDKYDTRLYVYDANDKGIYNDDPITYEDLNTILNVQAKPIQRIEGLYYYESSYDKFNYITRRDVTDTAGKKLGSFFIVSNPKNSSREAILPELFRQFQKIDPVNSPVYSNAVYVNKQLVSPPGNYPFAIRINDDELPKEGFQQKTNGDFDELWYRSGNDKVVVIARKKEKTIEAITLFSYIFCSFLFLVAFVQLVSLILRTGFNKKELRKIFQLNIRSQVHSTIIFISIFSFIIIGIATISFFIKRYNRNNNDKLSRTMKIMVNEIAGKLYVLNPVDQEGKRSDSVSTIVLQNLVNEVSDIHGVDVNIYNLEGNLRVSSEANVYSKGVLSKKMDPSAFYHLNRMRQVLHAQEEKIGNFYYLSIYSPVRDNDGKLYAYINIPYFTSKPELRQEISNFLVTIINLNAFILLIAGLIALFIANRITGSFSLISDKMREVNLGKMNEQINWSRNDEIGELVKEYNKMVAKLGDSAAMLAKSEREGAWREMARQVAHEIKNPLTPMKLSIQYLQKAIDNNQPNVKELSGNVANTLVEQIDHLSKIAADFSQFANIGTTNVELFDLHDVIGSLKDLFRPNQNVELVWYPVNERVMLNADKTQMNRLFTNLFTNALEACSENGICRIEVNERRDGDKIIVSIKDDGEGIPPEMQERIFIPNFTTKSSGTGLGLAMCKGIVEQAKGKIWFETEQGRGTTFYVELPVVN